MLAYFYQREGHAENIVFTSGVTLALMAALVLVSRRVMFATVLVGGLVAIIITAATVKRQIMNMVVHAYDLFFYLSSWSTVSFLWNDHRRYLLALAGSLLALIAAGAAAWKLDGTRLSRRYALAALLVGIAAGAWGAHNKGERRHMQFYFENLFVSSFYASWAETIETFWRGQLVEAASAATGPRFTLPTACTTGAEPATGLPGQKPPHIILIHQESVVPPAIFPQVSYDRAVDPFFHSHDGRLHRMRVETYGGASWLTEFSILAGISTQSFGGMRQFVQSVMQGKVRDTLPEVLARCGYRNVVFYPMLKNFVSNARFYQSVGLKEIFDLKDQGARTAQERDRFYYGNALNEIERHVRSAGVGSTQPIFTFIQTMAAHWPYDVTYMPEEKVAGGGPGTHPEMHEYLRRVSMAVADYNWLMSELKRRFPRERILIVHYGDHQPTATRTLLGHGEEVWSPEDMALAPDSVGFLTYFAVQGHNYEPPALPEYDIVDVPYLGAIILRSAGLPMSDAMRERKRLLDVCKGHYYGCARKDEILTFHRRLIDSRLMDAR